MENIVSELSHEQVTFDRTTIENIQSQLLHNFAAYYDIEVIQEPEVYSRAMRTDIPSAPTIFQEHLQPKKVKRLLYKAGISSCPDETYDVLCCLMESELQHLLPRAHSVQEHSGSKQIKRVHLQRVMEATGDHYLL